MDPISVSFNEGTSRNWSTDRDTNFMFVRMVCSYCNDRLKAAGFVFLNDAFIELGLPPTKEGQRLGWLEGSTIEFWQGEFPLVAPIVLKFNVDGDILDKVDWAKVERRNYR